MHEHSWLHCSSEKPSALLRCACARRTATFLAANSSFERCNTHYKYMRMPSRQSSSDALRSVACQASSPAHQTTANVEVDAFKQPETELDSKGLTRLKFKPEGWNHWMWRGHRIHYIKAGSDKKPPILLVHGFGASAYHWRYVVPELGKHYNVHAIDLLGFGFSEKPSVDYNGYTIWSEQLNDYIKQMFGGKKTVLVGNSMGAYASLLTSANFPEVSRGLVLVNGAGKFEEVKAAAAATVEAGLDSEALKEAVQEGAQVSSSMSDRQVESQPQSPPSLQASSTSSSSKPSSFLSGVLDPLQALAKRTGIYLAFLAAKQPSRIRQVLKQVYASQNNVDEDLVTSISSPAQDRNAPDVFYRVISSNGASINSLLPKLQAPVFLLWGKLDPWITPASADKIQKIYPEAERVDIAGGHCPHDDVPELFLPPLESWLAKLPTS